MLANISQTHPNSTYSRCSLCLCSSKVFTHAFNRYVTIPTDMHQTAYITGLEAELFFWIRATVPGILQRQVPYLQANTLGELYDVPRYFRFVGALQYQQQLGIPSCVAILNYSNLYSESMYCCILPSALPKSKVQHYAIFVRNIDYMFLMLFRAKYSLFSVSQSMKLLWTIIRGTYWILRDFDIIELNAND